MSSARTPKTLLEMIDARRPHDAWIPNAEDLIRVGNSSTAKTSIAFHAATDMPAKMAENAVVPAVEEIAKITKTQAPLPPNETRRVFFLPSRSTAQIAKRFPGKFPSATAIDSLHVSDKRHFVQEFLHKLYRSKRYYAHL